MQVAVGAEDSDIFVRCDRRGNVRSPIPGDNWIMQEAITRDPEVKQGAAVFRGTRVQVLEPADFDPGDVLSHESPC